MTFDQFYPYLPYALCMLVGGIIGVKLVYIAVHVAVAVFHFVMHAMVVVFVSGIVGGVLYYLVEYGIK